MIEFFIDVSRRHITQSAFFYMDEIYCLKNACAKKPEYIIPHICNFPFDQLFARKPQNITKRETKVTTQLPDAHIFFSFFNFGRIENEYFNVFRNTENNSFIFESLNKSSKKNLTSFMTTKFTNNFVFLMRTAYTELNRQYGTWLSILKPKDLCKFYSGFRTPFAVIYVSLKSEFKIKWSNLTMKSVILTGNYENMALFCPFCVQLI